MSYLVQYPMLVNRVASTWETMTNWDSPADVMKIATLVAEREHPTIGTDHSVAAK
ncbi:MAG: hypothetical protein ACLP6E_02515 [Acidimicrobiales bacterium]